MITFSIYETFYGKLTGDVTFAALVPFCAASSAPSPQSIVAIVVFFFLVCMRQAFFTQLRYPLMQFGTLCHRLLELGVATSELEELLNTPSRRDVGGSLGTACWTLAGLILLLALS